MFGQKSETPQWKTNVAGEYIDKILSEEKNLVTKQIDESLFFLKKDTENNSLTNKVKDNLQNFLVSNGLLSSFKGIFSRQLLSEESQKKIEQAQKDISDSSTEQEARQKLGLRGSIDSSKDTEEIINNQENTEQQESFYVGTLSSLEKKELEELKKQSNTPNNINYLKNRTYLKYLNNIESELKLPKDTLQSVCLAESGGYLYKGNNIIGSHAGAQGLFQFMPGTADYYMKNKTLTKKYGKKYGNRKFFLKDPLASAWASGIMLSENMEKYSFDLPSSLAGYNRGPGNIQKIGGKINGSNFNRLPKETKNYVQKICKNILKFNGKKQPNNIENIIFETNKLLPIKIENKKFNNSILIGPKIIAQKPNEFGGIGNSIMTGFQGYSSKKNFKNMDGIEGKNTKTHPNRFKSKEDVKKRKNTHSGVKSFVMYFGANTKNNSQTLNDLEKRSIWLKEEGIQPILSTCIGANNNAHLNQLNTKILELGKKLDTPVLDFSSQYSQDKSLFDMLSNNHPSGTGYDFMKDQILSAAA